MFKTVLIANRGEIASRIIKTVQDLGSQAIAVYCEADKHSPYVYQANQAFSLTSAEKGYLDIEAILDIAVQCQAEAIHPGYGLLSENYLFAKACQARGLVFIGPSVKTIKLMGSKKAAKRWLESYDIPVIPGYHGNNQEASYLLEQAHQLGFPLLIKAAHGGGGKGMRRVYQASQFNLQLAAVQREALTSFGNSQVILEKLLINPKHIEIQILADNHGQVLALFDRDCSVQRRHQKIIEEAPASFLASELRGKLTNTACTIAKLLDYRNAGTVEFLVDKEQKYYFIEMNTRLQVEHPVTEMITNMDLVYWQLAIAANAHLPSKIPELLGHAIECRIYAEDPNNQFIPSAGTIDFYNPPLIKGVRVDSAIALNSVVSNHYDALVAKLISYGKTRQQAIYRMQQALENFAIGGVRTNIHLLQAIISHAEYIQVQHHTHWLAKEKLILPKADVIQALLMAVSYDYLTLFLTATALKKATFGWQTFNPRPYFKNYRIDKAVVAVCVITHNASQFRAQLLDEEYNIEAEIQDTRLHLAYNGQKYKAYFNSKATGMTIFLKEQPVEIEYADDLQAYAPTSDANHCLNAPMHATVVAVLKTKGDTVCLNEPLIILESMKMEHTLHAPNDGIIDEIFCTTGMQVKEGEELLKLGF